MSIIESIFGESQIPVWEEFAKQHNGTLKSESGDLFVEYEYSNFILKVKNYNHVSGSSYSESYMVGMAEFLHPSQLELQITKKDWFISIMKLFKKKKIKVGNDGFDKRFFITSNKELKAITILKDKSLLEKIISFNPTRIEITNVGESFGEIPSKGKYMLYCAKQEKFKDLTQLNEIHSVLVSFIENLKVNCEIQ